MAALQYVDVPNYSAILFRRTYADLALPGALMDRFREWVGTYDDVHWNANMYTATFPSGARITFGYLNNVNDYLRYKGSEFQFIGMDEVTEIRSLTIATCSLAFVVLLLAHSLRSHSECGQQRTLLQTG